ncbi:MAG: MCP four helix bundle domain-containing protein [Cytophagales bacterium]|nr:MCP four helix bundle domain-containing protein [Cytophagales bacterium]
MTLFEKVKWVLGILLIFVVVLTTNLVDRGNFNRIRNSVVTIYEDRIVANDLIFEISTLVHEKELAFRTSDSDFFKQRNPAINENLGALISRYSQTKITPSEQRVFDDLKAHLADLQNLEKNVQVFEMANNQKVRRSMEIVKANLADLSKIQLREGKREMALSERTFESINLFTKIEIIFLVLMAVLVQVIILYKPKED